MAASYFNLQGMKAQEGMDRRTFLEILNMSYSHMPSTLGHVFVGL